MKEWLNKLLSSSDEVSTKRLISLICLLALLIVIVCALKGVVVADIIYYTLTGLITGGSLMGTIEKIKESKE